jgi:uncharacterized protein (DUF58 family)
VVTGRLALAAVLAAGLALALPLPVFPALLVLNGGLLLVATVDWALASRPERFTVERELPGIVPLGGEATVTWWVRNPARRANRVRLADELVPSLGAGTRRARLTVPAGGRASARTTLHPSRRGRFSPDNVTLRVAGPLGLAARQRRLRVPGSLRVYPPFHSRDEAELRINKARILEVGLRSAQGRGGGTEFDSLREYGLDDEFRRIDWAATARAGKPIVRTYRAERNQTVLLLLDAGRTMAGKVELPAGVHVPDQGKLPGVPRLDHAMDAVMMLTAVATRLGDRAGLVAFDDRVRAVVPPGHTRDQLSRVTEAMYALEPALVESDYRGAFAETLARFRRRAMLVIYTELAAEAVSETLLPALPLIARDHIVVVASVTDPQVAAWARAVPTDAGSAYRKAAAVTALSERRRTVARLRALGATVVDAEPGQLAPRLADAYLKVKATGRL